MNSALVKRKIRRRLPPYFGFSLLAEGLAVGALIHGRVCLMGANQDLVQGAVVLVAAMMGALSDGTFDTLVSMAIHNERPPLIWIRE